MMWLNLKKKNMLFNVKLIKISQMEDNLKITYLILLWCGHFGKLRNSLVIINCTCVIQNLILHYHNKLTLFRKSYLFSDPSIVLLPEKQQEPKI